MQKFIALGRIGQDPEIRSTQSGKVASFSLATSKKWKTKEGEQKEATEWHNCVAWEKKAELIEQYVKKGDLLFIEGELKTDKYEKDGQTHYSTKIIVTQMEFASRAKQPEGKQSEIKDAGSDISGYANNNEDDLPF